MNGDNVRTYVRMYVVHMDYNTIEYRYDTVYGIK